MGNKMKFLGQGYQKLQHEQNRYRRRRMHITDRWNRERITTAAAAFAEMKDVRIFEFEFRKYNDNKYDR